MRILPLEGVNNINEVLEPGTSICTIQYQDIPGEDESDIYHRSPPNVLLNNIFEIDETNQRFFVIPNVNQIIGYPLYISVKNISTKKETISKVMDGYNDISSIMEIINLMKKPAEFGDLLQQKTRTDDNVRKGFDIPFGVEVNGHIMSNKYDLKNLETLFMEKTGYLNIKIVPYKFNIYEEGDFFAEHRDSPEKNLIATIIYVISGKGGSFYLNGQNIESSKDTLIFFYPEIPHEVKDVSVKRITMTFKVFTLSEVHIPNPNISMIASNLSKRIKIGDAILLNGGYSFFQEEIPFVPKGLDKTLFDALKELDYDYELRPVIVENVIQYSNEGYFDENGKSKIFTPSDIPNDRTHFSTGLINKEDDGDDNTIYKIVISNVNEKLSKFFGLGDGIRPTNVLYMGLGFKVGEGKHLNPFIGNQHNGFVLSNFYYNLIAILKNQN